MQRDEINFKRTGCAALILLGLVGCWADHPAAAPPQKPPVRVAVVSNIISSGLWGELSFRFTKTTGWPVEVVFSGEREDVAAALRNGKCDLATLHSGDMTGALIDDRVGMNLQPWTISEMVIVGPRADPAGIRGMKDGAAALKRIAQTQSPFLSPQGRGSRDMAEALWTKAGIEPKGDWIITQQGGGGGGTGGGHGGGHGGGKGGGLGSAATRGAYAISGRISAERQTAAAGSPLEILVTGDPEMLRPFVVIEANPVQFPGANAEGAKVLSDFLVCPAVQDLLASFKPAGFGAQQWFMPLKGS